MVECVRVDFEDGVERRAGGVDLGDTSDVVLGYGAGGGATFGEVVLELGDAGSSLAMARRVCEGGGRSKASSRRRERRAQEVGARVVAGMCPCAACALVCFGARSPGLHELLLPASGNGVVMTELHSVGALTSGEGFQAELIFRDFRQRHKRFDGRALAGQRVVATDAGPAGRQVAGDVADGASREL